MSCSQQERLIFSLKQQLEMSIGEKAQHGRQCKSFGICHMWLDILTLGQFLISTPYLTSLRNGNNVTPGRKITHGKCQASEIISGFPQKSFFVFLQKLVLKSLASMKVGVLGKKGHLSVALQIASPLTNKLSTANTVSFQGPRYPWFSSGICVFLATSQLRRRLGLLRCTVGPMFPLNYHSISSQSSDSASDIQCWGSPFFRSLDMSPLKGQAPHSFIVPCLIQNCRMVYTMQKGCSWSRKSCSCGDPS